MTLEQSVFILSNQALSAVVGKIGESQWDMKLPSWFKTGRTQAGVTLRTIINYHAYDDAWVPDVLAGKTIQEVGKKFDGDLLGDDAVGNFARYNDAACEAVRGLSNPELVVHLTYGDFPAKVYLMHTMSFRGFRAYDIAKLVGADTRLPSDLVAGMWDLLSPYAEEWRKVGVYGPETPLPANPTPQDRLLAKFGQTI